MMSIFIIVIYARSIYIVLGFVLLACTSEKESTTEPSNRNDVSSLDSSEKDALERSVEQEFISDTNILCWKLIKYNNKYDDSLKRVRNLNNSADTIQLTDSVSMHTLNSILGRMSKESISSSGTPLCSILSCDGKQEYYITRFEEEYVFFKMAPHALGVTLSENETKFFQNITTKLTDNRCDVSSISTFKRFSLKTQFDSLLGQLYINNNDSCLNLFFSKDLYMGTEFYHLNVRPYLDSLESLDDANLESILNISVHISRSNRRKNHFEYARIRRLSTKIDYESFMSDKLKLFGDDKATEIYAVLEKFTKTSPLQSK